MKRSLLICLASVAMVVFITLALAVRVTTSATTVTESKQEFPIHYSDEADYMALMARCAQDGTQEALATGAIYEEQRNAKIAATGAAYKQTNFFIDTDPKTILKNIVKYNSMYLSEYNTVKYYSDDDARMLAKVLYSECRGLPSVTEQACVAWVVLNRVDNEPGVSIKTIITRPNQFAYYSSTPVDEDLLNLAHDVLARWNAEKNGATYVGRVLPTDYRYFSGDGKHNYFRNAFGGDYSVWDYSLPSPYES